MRLQLMPSKDAAKTNIISIMSNKNFYKGGVKKMKLKWWQIVLKIITLGLIQFAKENQNK